MNPFFKAALGIKQSPSSSRLRQRFDEDACALIPLLDEASVEFLCNASVPIGTLFTGHVPLDIDVFPMDNSHTDAARTIHDIRSPRGYLWALVKNYYNGTFTPTATEQVQAKQQRQQSKAQHQQSEAEREAAAEAGHWRYCAKAAFNDIIHHSPDITDEALAAAVEQVAAKKPKIAGYLQQQHDDFLKRRAERKAQRSWWK